MSNVPHLNQLLKNFGHRVVLSARRSEELDVRNTVSEFFSKNGIRAGTSHFPVSAIRCKYSREDLSFAVAELITRAYVVHAACFARIEVENQHITVFVHARTVDEKLIASGGFLPCLRIKK